ncbi:hypothetical protein Q7P37_007037 [Cladosporium fusiforme]
MSVDAYQTFRFLLLAEAGLNLASVVPMFIDPEHILTWLFESPDHITPAACTLTQWCGCIITGLTVPLLLSFRNGPDAPVVRRITYTTYAAVELAIGSLVTIQYFSGGSGLKSEALWASMTTMAALVAVRIYYLFIMPEYMVEPPSEKKSQ